MDDEVPEEKCFDDVGHERVQFDADDEGISNWLDYDNHGPVDLNKMMFEILDRIPHRQDEEWDGSDRWYPFFHMLHALMKRAFVAGFKFGSSEAAETAIEEIEKLKYEGYGNDAAEIEGLRVIYSPTGHEEFDN